MLEFFRKYQTYFFILITIVIVISFSFFGTYNTLPANTLHEQVVFKAVDGTEVTRHELEQMVNFISSDSHDKLMFGGIWGPNFLNDGVVSKDILASGLGTILLETYPEMMAIDLDSRQAKEHRNHLYVHPQANFISIEGAWAYMMPEMKQYYNSLRKASNGISHEAFSARVNLYLGERKFTPYLLKQVLRYQEKQFNWISPDPNLERIDLSLFGYHTLQDWFGPRFLRVVAEFIINASQVAEQKGYQISKEEAWADLQRNSEISFRQNLKNPQLGVTSSHEYLQEQLRRLSMDQTKATRVWQQVLLFRRLFQDIGNSVFIDPLSHQQFFAYAQETVEGDLYKLPPALRFGNYQQLQKFEIYLQYVAKHYKKGDLHLPREFFTAEQVKKKAAELVKKNYTLLVAQAAKKPLQSKISLKEMWQWEVQDQNWDKLKKEFPDLGIKNAHTREQRMAALDELDDLTRSKVDGYARNAIVEMHPEWLKEALESADAKEMKVAIRFEGGKPLFGLENREFLIQLLDQAPLVSNVTPSEKEKQAAEKLSHFTGDQNVYYKIAVIKRDADEQILTFEEANQEGALDQLSERLLKDQVADLYFDPILTAIQSDYEKTQSDTKTNKWTTDRSASLRFYAYVRGLQESLAKGETPRSVEDPLANQWQLEKTAYKLARSEEAKEIEVGEFFKMLEGSWTSPATPVNGDLYFFHLQRRGPSEDITAQMEKLHQAQELLSNEAQQIYMKQLMQEIKAKDAISVEYLDSAVEVE